MSETSADDYARKAFTRAALAMLAMIPECRELLENGQYIREVKIEFVDEQPDSESILLFPCRAVE